MKTGLNTRKVKSGSKEYQKGRVITRGLGVRNSNALGVKDSNIWGIEKSDVQVVGDLDINRVEDSEPKTRTSRVRESNNRKIESPKRLWPRFLFQWSLHLVTPLVHPNEKEGIHDIPHRSFQHKLSPNDISGGIVRAIVGRKQAY